MWLTLMPLSIAVSVVLIALIGPIRGFIEARSERKAPDPPDSTLMQLDEWNMANMAANMAMTTTESPETGSQPASYADWAAKYGLEQVVPVYPAGIDPMDGTIPAFDGDWEPPAQPNDEEPDVSP